MHKLDILKLKDFITLQKILFINDWLEEERLKSFNITFKQMETNQFHNTRSINTHQLKIRGFKTEKYDRFSILKKCWSDWNVLQNSLELILKKSNVQKSKHVSQTTFLKNTQNNSKKNKHLHFFKPYALFF